MALLLDPQVVNRRQAPVLSQLERRQRPPHHLVHGIWYTHTLYSTVGAPTDTSTTPAQQHPHVRQTDGLVQLGGGAVQADVLEHGVAQATVLTD